MEFQRQHQYKEELKQTKEILKKTNVDRTDDEIDTLTQLVKNISFFKERQ